MRSSLCPLPETPTDVPAGSHNRMSRGSSPVLRLLLQDTARRLCPACGSAQGSGQEGLESRAAVFPQMHLQLLLKMRMRAAFAQGGPGSGQGCHRVAAVALLSPQNLAGPVEMQPAPERELAKPGRIKGLPGSHATVQGAGAGRIAGRAGSSRLQDCPLAAGRSRGEAHPARAAPVSPPGGPRPRREGTPSAPAQVPRGLHAPAAPEATDWLKPGWLRAVAWAAEPEQLSVGVAAGPLASAHAIPQPLMLLTAFGCSGDVMTTCDRLASPAQGTLQVWRGVPLMPRQMHTDPVSPWVT